VAGANLYRLMQVLQQRLSFAPIAHQVRSQYTVALYVLFRVVSANALFTAASRPDFLPRVPHTETDMVIDISHGIRRPGAVLLTVNVAMVACSYRSGIWNLQKAGASFWTGAHFTLALRSASLSFPVFRAGACCARSNATR
jgi:hypothetical protein